MSYSYFDNNNKINKFDLNNIKIGQKWSEIKTNNKQLDSNFLNSRVDINKDGKVDKDEVNLLKALFKLADGLTTKANDSSAADGTLQNDELAELNKQLNTSLDNEIMSVKDGKANVPQNKSVVDITSYNGEYYAMSREIDYSSIDPSQLQDGNYYLDKNFSSGKYESSALKMQDTTKGAAKNWSEGLSRQIGTVRMQQAQEGEYGAESLNTVINEMQQIGTEVGFDVQLVHSNSQWIEDTHIRRHDGSIYVPTTNENFSNIVTDDVVVDDIRSRRANIQGSAQGAIAQRNSGVEYAKTVPESDRQAGESYLEGGNVLNTLKADGKPGAIIGEESIDYTLKKLKLDKNETNIKIAKAVIAQDLKLKEEDVTFIPQFDFHIDMAYRPLKNGEIAVPDFKAGVEFLQNNNIESMDAETKQKLIEYLSGMDEQASPLMQEAEENLTKNGYKVVKIPCFSANGRNGVPAINYMNGVAGTSNSKGSLPEGTTYYITNKSDYPEINNFMQNYLKENAGIDKTYFVSTSSFLRSCGGIDCLTEEYVK